MIDLRNEFDFASMRFGNLPNNRQTESTATLLATFARITSPESLENSILILETNSRPLILHRHPYPLTFDPTA
jgi:hypothetical protein